MNYHINGLDIKQILDEHTIDIYEIALALQGVSTKNHLEKLDQIELGDMLELKNKKIIKIMIDVLNKGVK